MSSSTENLNPRVLQKLLRDLKAFQTKPLEGITVICNDEDIADIQAVIEGPAETPFAGGRFRVRLALGADFPASPPKGFFLTKIFHPNVGEQGEICVDTLKRDWKPEYGVAHILQVIKCLLIYPNPESALNEEAGKLILEDYAEYSKMATLFTSIHAVTEGEGSKPVADKRRVREEKKKKQEKRRNLKRL